MFHVISDFTHGQHLPCEQATSAFANHQATTNGKVVMSDRPLIDGVSPDYHHHISCIGHVPQGWPPSGHNAFGLWWPQM